MPEGQFFIVARQVRSGACLIFQGASYGDGSKKITQEENYPHPLLIFDTNIRFTDNFSLLCRDFRCLLFIFFLEARDNEQICRSG
jgi:hypothetical protein